jgi:23S rRNA (cytosine1962-C5)-methyltransferase
MKLHFRVPHQDDPEPLEALLRRAWPNATDEQINGAFKGDRVRVNERLARNPDKVPSADEEVTAEVELGAEAFGLPEAAELARGNGWVVVEKPVGMPGELDRDDPMNPILYLADTLGLDRSTFTPAWSMPAAMGGPWLFGTDEQAAADLLEAWASGDLMITWSVLVPSPARGNGTLQAGCDIPINYGATNMREGISELQLTPMPQEGTFEEPPEPVELILDALAAAQIPALADASRGGYIVDGALRLSATALYRAGSDLAHSWTPDEDWWPVDPVVVLPEQEELEAPAAPAADIGVLEVSPKTIEVLTEQGHPWVLADAQTGERSHLPPGSIVELRGTDDSRGPFALIEGTGKLAARVWSEDREAAESFGDEIDLRVDEAFARRAELTAQTQRTDLFRLIHGEADGLPGLLLDRVGPLLRATLVGATGQGFREQVYENILDFDPDMMILEVEHLRDIRTAEMPSARVVNEGAGYVAPGERVVGVEDELKYWTEPWEGIDVGFFADQRDNRRKTRAVAEQGQRWLNLFCHTGAFTVVLVDEGCEVTSVDISARYLRWLEDNLELNGLPQSLNTSVAEDARAFVDDCETTFDGIIVDPPTAAAGDEGFWSVRSDYQDLLASCFELLAPAGSMLVCRNDKRATRSLSKLTRRAAKQAARTIGKLDDAPPAFDYPSMPGFPEGDSFEGVWVKVD